ncbi:MAG: 7-cyano-7-deazaguanine synthase QueC [Elusimicrobia bacterium]|nr:7-cyano-7-deazaguanine synthase QueC [Elusimicrobiota bacterium]MBU2613953.1 7-cyano-7-deazaguanine synthase QueC [Elusimicrobiota bacterium]
MKKAVILLSGGLDSATALYYAKAGGYKTHCLIFDYGQKHKKEIEQAKKIAKISGSQYSVIKFQLPWKGSSLTDKTKKIPSHKLNEIGRLGILPSTYVPARNTIFLSFGLSLAETIKARAIFIGANALDFSGYPDCRPKYFSAWSNLIKSLGLRSSKIKIAAPLIAKTKSEIVKLGLKLKVPYSLTWSCYAGGKKPCGNCDSCKLREKGFSELKLNDPSN